ncbi:MAG TPA: alpha/beta hydrolase fold domain-containing protein [Solirubrobacterales bacterium]|nr:alpha/beta hydrolase fold domain-containing protein [Solirubrobacterales bacterium]
MRSPRQLALSAAVLIVALLAAAPAEGYYRSVTEPPDGVARGTVLTIHGGGWLGDIGSYSDFAMSVFIYWYSRAGYRVVNTDYRTGHSIDDATTTLRWIRRRYGRRPICIQGVSSGAQIALVLAKRFKLACVIAESVPPTLLDWGAPRRLGEPYAWDAFRTRRRLKHLSPSHFAHQVREPVLVAGAPCDRLIAWRKQRRLARDLPRGKLLRLSSATHCPRPPAWKDLAARAKPLLARTLAR